MAHYLPDEAATLAVGAQVAQRACAQLPFVVHLHGDLGAGKTTFVRGVLRALGFAGTVKSPTYTLVESYATASCHCHHMDLYRLADPQELDYIGIDALWSETSVFLIEWPEMGGDRIPPADLQLFLRYQGDGRELVLSDRNGNDFSL